MNPDDVTEGVLTNVHVAEQAMVAVCLRFSWQQKRLMLKRQRLPIDNDLFHPALLL